MRVAALVALLALTIAVTNALARDPAQVREFRKHNPCPATGQARGPCPGWEVDHITPLCAGGADHPSNLQWLTVREHREKTRGDIRTYSVRQ